MVRVAWCVLIALTGLAARAQTAPDSTSVAGAPAAEVSIDTLAAPPAAAPTAASPAAPVDPRTPAGALFRSLAVPGWGQVYNGQWGKAPIALGAVVGMTTLVLVNHFDYLDWREAYLYIVCEAENTDCDPDQPGVNPNAGFIGTWQALGEPSTPLALSNRDVLRRNRDYAILIGLLVYGLQALDAFVAAHLLDFDVSEDLSLRALPTIDPTGRAAPSVRLRWTF
ncbi:MAG: DUF5683 domain-containing protein [Bacteroidota bacterium]